jgi:para-nitrobenzyl esterase
MARVQQRVRWGLVAVALAAACAGGREETVAPPTADAEARRSVAQGALVGSAGRHGGHAFLGLPFAKPPVGELRWRAPQPPEPWSGTREALRFASPCVQYASALGGEDDARPGSATGSEDCLYLNVYAPRFAPESVPQGDARLPVMLWIHGGGNSIGSTSFYDASRLASSRQLVVVTTSYRLGPLGWFRHAALGEGAAGPEDRSGNYGTLDLVRALEWVRDNASAFGGDPGNVTIFGESAGGANVMSLLLSPEARGLFHRAIVQSGGAKTIPVAEAANYTDDDPPGDRNSSREVVLRLLEAEGVAADRAQAKARAEAMTPAELASWLRSLAAPKLLDAYGDERFGGMIRVPQLIRDGAVLPAEDSIASLGTPEGWNAVPTILGTNRDEVKLFLSFSPEFVRRWAILPYLRDAERYRRVADYQSRAWQASGADELAAPMSAWGTPIYTYRFDWDEEPRILWSDLGEILGAAHGLEIPFVFDHWDLGRLGKALFTEENAAGRLALSEQMTSYWTQHAYAGAPGTGRSGELPAWPAWRDGGEGGQLLVLDTPAGGGLRVSRETVRAQSLAEEVLADASIESPEERCRLVAGIAEHSPTFGPASYAALPACAKFPYAPR